jgi:hypothetical protein
LLDILAKKRLSNARDKMGKQTKALFGIIQNLKFLQYPLLQAAPKDLVEEEGA